MKFYGWGATAGLPGSVALGRVIHRELSTAGQAGSGTLTLLLEGGLLLEQADPGGMSESLSSLVLVPR